jgi:predicted SAM-dependent methyltransferase
MKHRLIAGTINHWPDDGEWRNWHLDVENRGIWSSALEITVQPDFVADIACLPVFRDEMFDEVRAHHVLEHLPRSRAVLALAEFQRILVPGGVLDIEVPDVAGVLDAYADGQLDHPGLAQWLYGEELPEHTVGDSHRYPWTELVLFDALEDAEFEVGDPLDAGLAVRFRAVKA